MSDSPLELVSAYMAAFGRRDLAALERLLAPDVTLQDPVVDRVAGRDEVLRINRELFESHTIELEPLRRYESPDGGIAQEFRLTLRPAAGPAVVVDGIDLFAFRDGRISAIRAYLHSK